MDDYYKLIIVIFIINVNLLSNIIIKNIIKRGQDDYVILRKKVTAASKG